VAVLREYWEVYEKITTRMQPASFVEQLACQRIGIGIPLREARRMPPAFVRDFFAETLRTENSSRCAQTGLGDQTGKRRFGFERDYLRWWGSSLGPDVRDQGKQRDVAIHRTDPQMPG
jgi:hypothetical protein